jgi:hypothetical protein
VETEAQAEAEAAAAFAIFTPVVSDTLLEIVLVFAVFAVEAVTSAPSAIILFVAGALPPACWK